MADIKTSEALRMSGKITIETYRAGMVEAVAPMIRRLQLILAGEYGPVAPSYIQGLRKRISQMKRRYYIGTPVECPNLIMQAPGVGLDLIIQRLVGTNTASLNLLYAEFGTGTNTPTLTDTALQTPVVRAGVSLQQDFANTDAIVQFYFSDAVMSNNTYTEVGTFVDGSGTLGSGSIFNHALLSPTYTKISGQDTTLNVDFNLANA